MELGSLQKAWLADLRGHPERQTEGVLGRTMKRNGDMLLCCLGQAKITLHEFNGGNAIDLFIERKNDATGSFLGIWELWDGSSDADLADSYEELGLYNADGLIAWSGEDVGCGRYNSLAAMNDSGVTWPEIADFIEEQPERVFAEPK